MKRVELVRFFYNQSVINDRGRGLVVREAFS